MGRNKKRKQSVNIVKEVYGLFEQAKSGFRENQELADRFIRTAIRLSMKHRISMPNELKRRFCKNCYKYLVPGINCRVRLGKGKRIMYCFGCKKYTRFRYKK